MASQSTRNLLVIYSAAWLRSFNIGLLGVVLGVYLSREGFSATAIGLVIAVIVGASFFSQRQPLAASGDGPRELGSDQATPTQPARQEEVTSEWGGGGFDFADELSAVNQSLGEIEHRRFPEWHYGDSWMQDLKGALNETNRLESSWPAGYDGSSSLKSPAGEIP